MATAKWLIVVGEDITGEMSFDDERLNFTGLGWVLQNGCKIVEVDPSFEIELGEKYVR